MKQPLLHSLFLLGNGCIKIVSTHFASSYINKKTLAKKIKKFVVPLKDSTSNRILQQGQPALHIEGTKVSHRQGFLFAMKTQLYYKALTKH